MGWGCIRPYSSDGKLSVCRRVKRVHDYSAGLLISISFGEPRPHRTLSVCTCTSQRQTSQHTQPKFINTYFSSLSFSFSAIVFITPGTRELNGKSCSAVSEREIWLSILMTRVIYSFGKLGMRLQVWNELVFQSSA